MKNLALALFVMAVIATAACGKEELSVTLPATQVAGGLDFGDDPAGVVHTQQVTFTISDDDVISKVDLLGTGIEDYTYSGIASGQTLHAGSSYPVVIAHAATATSVTGYASLAVEMNNKSGSGVSLAYGTGFEGTESVNPAPIAFGDTLLGNPFQQTLGFTRKRTTASDTVASVTISGAGASNYTYSGPGDSGPTTYAADGTSSGTVTFAPSVLGATDDAALLADFGEGDTISFTLTGNGTGVIVAPAAMAFSTGEPPVLRAPLTISNASLVDVVVQSVTVTGADASAFQINNFTVTTLAAASVDGSKPVTKLTLQVIFNGGALASGTYTANIEVQTSVGAIAPATAISGTVP